MWEGEAPAEPHGHEPHGHEPHGHEPHGQAMFNVSRGSAGASPSRMTNVSHQSSIIGRSQLIHEFNYPQLRNRQENEI